MDILKDTKNIFYLKSIQRNLNHLIDIMNRDPRVMKPSIQTEATQDNLEWLDEYIEQLEREANASTTTEAELEGGKTPGQVRDDSREAGEGDGGGAVSSGCGSRTSSGFE